MLALLNPKYGRRHSNIRSLLLSAFVIIAALNAAACSRVTTTKAGSGTSRDASKPAPEPFGGEINLTLPSWCLMTQSAEQLCFKCQRDDGGSQIPYEQCLTPAESFQADRDCAFNDSVTKSITCIGTNSPDGFVMDVSLAKEKVTAAVPAFLIALKLIAHQKFPERSNFITASDEISDFFLSRVPQITRGEDLDRISGDLLSMVNRHLTRPLNENQSTYFKNTALENFRLVAKDLSGTKDYSLSRVIQRGLLIARTIPDDLIDTDAKPFLTGPGLANLLSQEQSSAFIQTFRILSPSVFGIRSPEDLISELRNSR